MKEKIQHYYGDVLKSSSDLQTNACCTVGNLPPHLKHTLEMIHQEVSSHYYGCGLVYPHQLEGIKILDLGCGAGRDVFILAKLCGENGSITGVDITQKQLDIARRHQEYHKNLYSYKSCNTHFLKGDIESLCDLDLEPGSFDLIVSNCVINLSTDKEAVFRGAYKLLKNGGELYFSDIYSSKRIPEYLKNNEVLHGECLSGALYWNDFNNLAKKCGFNDPRLVEDRPILIEQEEIAEKLDTIEFHSATYRLFKIPELEHACEDYGQSVCYKGNIKYSEQAFSLDKHHYFEQGRWENVCGNSFDILNASRFKNNFDFQGGKEKHFGIFKGCGIESPFSRPLNTLAVTNGCC